MINSIKLSNYFELVHPKYTYIQIIPHKSIRNYNSSNIIKSISTTYKSINKRIHKENKKLFIETNFKLSYIIDISCSDCCFYFLVPICYKNIIIDKINEIWKKATIKELETIENLNNPLNYSLFYKKDDCLSLKVDKKTNNPLNQIINVADIMKDNDKIRIVYNFLPSKQSFWKDKYNEMLNKIENNKPLEKNIMSYDYILKSTLNIILSILQGLTDVINDFLGNTDNTDMTIFNQLSNILNYNNKKVLSKSTLNKKDSTIINTQILISSQSEDKTRQLNNILSTCNAYSSISEDNELIYKKVKNNPNILDYDFNIPKSLCSTDECQNFIQIPADNLLKEHKINYIDNTETEIPLELQNGIMCIGTNIFKGIKTKCYLSTDKDYRNLPLCVVAPNRSGKTTLLTNIAKDSINNNECSIIFDFCGECEASNEISSSLNKNKILNIDLSDFNNLQGLGFNECFVNTNDTFELYKSAKMQTSMLVNFINSINLNNQLEPRMNRYLKASSLIVFIQKGSINNVFEVLENHKIRKHFIDNIPYSQKDNLKEYILALQELDDWSKGTKDKDIEVIGTKISYIQSILNRLDLIKSNAYMELMLKKDCTNNFDLSYEIQKNQLICLRMPETMFSTDEEKDVYCAYWINKIWSALQVRHKRLKELDRIKVNIFFDELYQIPMSQTFLKKILNQIAKKTAKIIISCHSLNQISYIRPELKNANTSYMLIAGCTKEIYNDLKEELYPYELDDLLGLKRYHSLNLIKTNDGYARFITELPYK